MASLAVRDGRRSIGRSFRVSEGGRLSFNLAIPGAAVSLRVLNLDAVPTAENDRINLVRWRLAQELAVSYELACSYQVMEVGEKSGALLGIAIDARWLVCLTEACRIAQIVPTVIDAGFSHGGGLREQRRSFEPRYRQQIDPAFAHVRQDRGYRSKK